MEAIVTEIMNGMIPVWDFITDNMVPAAAADINMVHFSMWSGVIVALLGFFLSLILRRGRRA